MLRYFQTIGQISWALLKGMGLTFKFMFQSKTTIAYPHVKAPIPDRFRGMLDFHIDECIACDLCVRACPSNCISLESQRNTAGKKEIQNYTIDFGKCNWCRLCEEACPTNPKSVHHTLEYEVAFMSRDDFKITWLKDAQGRPLTPVNAAGQPVKSWGGNVVPSKFLSVGVGSHKAPIAAASSTPSPSA